jgi:hypothetical protein
MEKGPRMPAPHEVVLYGLKRPYPHDGLSWQTTHAPHEFVTAIPHAPHDSITVFESASREDF